ncbi:MAG: hypothetical protein S4CHLAM81_10120 [Chlamydiales bacterium]|nr:hypothetical protein [Chlamydiales bacterium]MCH9635790.1 hypothetical protein [Chlamydiales bacterium]MCH9704019.1 hypothetical protein [Chlamydiota bacterium]
MLTIKERLRPFSHTPGSRCLIPRSEVVVQAFPTKLIVGDKEYQLEGPVKQFTLMQDVQRCAVVVFSEKYRLWVWPDGSVSEKRPPLVSQERLFLGCTKKMEWEMVKRRCDMREILPLWFSLGQFEKSGSFEPLDSCDSLEQFERLFRSYFEQMMLPRSEDHDLLGYFDQKVDPSYLLAQGYRQIRKLFLDGDQVLPNLPPELHCGKLLTETIDLEWSKKQIRRVIVRAKEAPKMHFPKKIRRYRVTKKGEMLYLFDRFEK